MRQPLSYAKPVSRCASHVVGHTLFSALSNATYPERLYFGIVQQASAVARAQRRTTAAPTLPAALHQRAPDLQPGSRRCPVSPSSPRRAPLAGVSRGPARANATLPHATPQSPGEHGNARTEAPTCAHAVMPADMHAQCCFKAHVQLAQNEGGQGYSACVGGWVCVGARV